MDYLVLGLLLFKEMTIYELNNSFKKGLSLIYSASYGSLQNAVKKLLKNEWITYEEMVDCGRNKKIYHINQSGSEAFYQWMYGDISDKKLEVTILSKIYFMGLLKNKEERLELLVKMIEQVKETMDKLDAYENDLKSLDLPEAYKLIAKYQFKTLNYGINSHDAALIWLKELYDEVTEE